MSCRARLQGDVPQHPTWGLLSGYYVAVYPLHSCSRTVVTAAKCLGQHHRLSLLSCKSTLNQKSNTQIFWIDDGVGSPRHRCRS